MLKRITTLLLLAGLLAQPATAMGDNGGPGGGKGGSTKYGYVRITNLCDDAIIANVGNWSGLIFEPSSSHSYPIVIQGNSTTVDVTAILASDRSVQTKESAKVERDKETTAIITATTTGGQTTLSIEIVEPTKPKGQK